MSYLAIILFPPFSLLAGFCILSFVTDGGVSFNESLNKFTYLENKAVRSMRMQLSRKPAIHILFMGNSFTGGLPEMLESVADSDAASPFWLHAESAVGDQYLARKWTDLNEHKMLESRHWDYVVLQENSAWALSPERISDTYVAVGQWNGAIRQISAKPLLYETWSDKPGSRNYMADGSPLSEQKSDMAQQIINEQTTSLANAYDIPVVPIGQYMTYARQQPNAPDLYSTDYHHPSPGGFYFVALLFYRYFTGRTLDGVTYTPRELTTEEARWLIAIADQMPSP
jgi:hypothetical protein